VPASNAMDAQVVAISAVVCTLIACTPFTAINPVVQGILAPHFK
jgi:hypothetical protein